MNCRFPRPHAIKRMFCFPWAGGGASFYSAFGKEVTEDLEVLAMCLPGRESRFKENAYSCLKDMIDSIVHIIHNDYWDKPFIFFGHSMGALISFFVALEMKSRYGREPECMILSGTTAPNTPNVRDMRLRPKDLSKDTFMSKLQELGGTPPEFSQYPDLVDIYYPVMYSDFCLIEEMVYDLPKDGEPPLSCPIDFFDGSEDRDHSIEDWRKLSSGQLIYRQMPGGHFYLKQLENKNKLIDFLNMKYDSCGNAI